MSEVLEPSIADQAGDPLRTGRTGLLAFVRDAESEAVLREALGESAAGIRRGDLAAARAALQQMATPNALIVDVSGEPNPLGALDELAQFVEPGVRVLVLGERQDIGFYRQVTRGMGAVEYLHKPLSRELVARDFLPAITGRATPELGVRGGRLITVTGVRGGVGASTIAVNLALQFAERARHHTLLLDADPYTGTAALILGGEPGKGLRVALETPARVDELFLERATALIGDRLHVLAAEEPLDASLKIAPSAAPQLLGVLRKRFNFIVVDLPRAPSPLNRDLMELAHQRVLVIDPTLAAIRDALRFLGLPNGPGQPRRPIVVLNQDGARGALSRKQVCEALQLTPEIVIPFLPKQMHAAATLGTPALRQRGAFRTAIEQLAREAVPSAQPRELGAARAVRPGIPPMSLARGFGRRRVEPDESAPAGAPQGAAQTLAPARAPTPPAAPAPAPAPSGIAELRTICLSRLDPSVAAGMSQERLQVEVERLLADIADENRVQLNGREQQQLAAELVDDMLGLGPLEPLLEDETITDIMVNGPDRVFVEQRGKLRQSSVRFRNTAHVGSIAQRIAAAVGRRVDESSPMVDARLADGSRVNIIFPPLALNGACISIRKFSRQQISFEALAAKGSVTPQLGRVLEIGARCRLNVIVSGGTGAGKTTLLNAMSRMIDPAERIVTIEDAAELQLQQPHVVRLETRPPNLEGRGEVTQRDLVRNALRMRPDRVIVGEVRGAEAFDMLQAMNTGHDGSMSTIHANNTRDAITRIENMVQMGQPNLPLRAIRTQIVSAIDLLVQVERMRDGVRRVTQVTEVMGLEGEIVTLNNVFQYQYEGEEPDGTLLGRYAVSRVRPGFMQRLVYYNLDRAYMAAVEEAGR